MTVHPVAAPALSGVAPAVAPTGSVLALTGTQFTSTPGTVRVNGTLASVMAWTPTAVGALVSAGATSGPVTVTAGGQTSNGVGVAVQPALTALSPPAGAGGDRPAWLRRPRGAVQIRASGSREHREGIW